MSAFYSEAAGLSVVYDLNFFFNYLMISVSVGYSLSFQLIQAVFSMIHTHIVKPERLKKWLKLSIVFTPNFHLTTVATILLTSSKSGDDNKIY